jgi:hypothetical protein
MILDIFKYSLMYPFKKISNWLILDFFIVLFIIISGLLLIYSLIYYLMVLVAF